MTQGLFINGSRPKSKKAVKEAVASGARVRLEATSFFGNEYDGSVNDAPDGTYTFVGPDPERSRVFYGNIVVSTKNGVRSVVVK